MPSTVYIETTIIGHLTSRIPRNEKVAWQMTETREWWDRSRDIFAFYTSELVRDEISSGDPDAAAERLKVFAGLPLLPVTEAAFELADRLLRAHALPSKARIDATHLSVAAVNGMDYLATWNLKHLANATLRRTIERTCSEAGYNCPIICTIDQLQ